MRRLMMATILALLAGPLAAQEWRGFFGGVTSGATVGEGTHVATVTYGAASTDATGYGIVAGYAMQAGAWTWGPELQVQFGDGLGGTFNHASGTSDMTLSTQSVTTLSVRAGRGSDKLIISGSLGLALVDVDATFTNLSTPNALTINDNMTGVVLGLAVDYVLETGWRLRGELRHFEGLEASNPNTPYPGLIPVALSAATRTYDWQDVTVSLIRTF